MSRIDACRRGLAVRCLWAMLGSLPLLPSPPAVAQAGEDRYRLGPDDKIRLKVFEWRASQDQAFEWKPLNDEFTVSAAGTLSIPLAGEIQAQGLEPTDVAAAVAAALQRRMGLNAPPDAAIDIVQYRPFYVSGDVVRPGPYPYRPGLTVLGAVATAGGLIRRADPSRYREAISGRGDLRQIAQDMVALLVRRARLQAEIDGSATITLPPELSGPSAFEGVAAALQAETLIFTSRQTAFATQLEALGQLKQFLAKEIESIDAQLTTVDTQMQLVNKELANVASLVDKGMAVAPRQMALERSVAQITGDRLGMQTNKLRVQEELSKADLAIIDLKNGRTKDAAVELRDTQVKLVELRNRADLGNRLLAETELNLPMGRNSHGRAVPIEPSYSILHSDNGKSDPAVQETAHIGPGDTLKVDLPLGGGDAALASDIAAIP